MVCFLTHFLICKLFSIISKIKTIPVRESVNDGVQADDYWWYLFCIQLLHLKLQYLHLILLFWKKIIHCLIKLMSYNNRWSLFRQIGGSTELLKVFFFETFWAIVGIEERNTGISLLLIVFACEINIKFKINVLLLWRKYTNYMFEMNI
jgi:hypothetical protein